MRGLLQMTFADKVQTEGSQFTCFIKLDAKEYTVFLL